MGSTNKTEIGLSQFIGTDVPGWLTDYNNDMETITKNVVDLKNVTSTVISGKINLMESQISSLTDTVTQDSTRIGENSTAIMQHTASITSNALNIKNVDDREAAHYAALSGQADGQGAKLTDIEKKQTYFEQNMNKIETDVTLVTASVSQMALRLEGTRKLAEANESDIDALDTQVADNTAKLDSVETQTRTNTASIFMHGLKISKNSTDINDLTGRVATLETETDEIPGIKENITVMTASISAMKIQTDENTGDISGLKKVTANITEGVEIPFGFGKTASGIEGYKNAEGNINPFITPDEYSNLISELEAAQTSINEIRDHIKNILEGASIPFNFGIAQGGAYGYIPNGQQGVVPFLTENDVQSIVNITPLETDIQTLKTDVETLSVQKADAGSLPDVTTANGTRILSDIQTNYPTLQVKNPAKSGQQLLLQMRDNAAATVVRFGVTQENSNQQNIDIPFGFGKKAVPNMDTLYGYIRADGQLSPFTRPINRNDNIALFIQSYYVSDDMIQKEDQYVWYIDYTPTNSTLVDPPMFLATNQDFSQTYANINLEILGVQKQANNTVRIFIKKLGYGIMSISTQLLLLYFAIPNASQNTASE